MSQPPSSKHIISAIEASSIAKSQNLTIPQLLPSLVKSAQNLAVTPISKFPVGAVGLASDGRIYFGANIEFPGLPLHHSIHAEQFLVTNLAAHGGGSKLLYLAVSATPCGHCRQFFQELRGISETQIVITDQCQEKYVYKPFSSIFPDPFGPYDLLDQQTPLILEKHDNRITLKDENFITQIRNKPDLSNGVYELIDKNENSHQNEKIAEARGIHVPSSDLVISNVFYDLIIKNQECLKTEALAAARESHAPYSGCPSGVALMDSDGRVYKGSYMESAAYNPSMMPVQAALVAYMVAGGGGYERIVAAVMVEKGVLVRQGETARLMLKHISPKCDIQVLHCD